MRIYLAGPMRNIEEFNFPTFHAAAAMLREKGHEVFSPVERDIKRHGWINIFRGTTGDLKELEKYSFDIHEALAEDTAWICQHAEAIALLPGWTYSKGAVAEHALCVALGLKIKVIHELLPGFVTTHPTRLERDAMCKANPGPFIRLGLDPPLNLVENARRLDQIAELQAAGKTADPPHTGTKPSNPKDELGIRRMPMSTVPAPVLAGVGVAMLEGALKYGRHNYRSIGVRASVYYDATMRHLMAWWEGEDLDPDSDISHITKAIASLVVLGDAELQGNLTDDRPPRSPANWYQKLNSRVTALLEKYPNPVKPYTHQV
jgi:Domain of unknown function (DUF5664)/Domain of unknown function (DUF4406)